MTLSPNKQALVDAFEKHVNAELNRDLDITLATMNDDPHLNNIPTLIGGIGLEGVRKFYSQFVPHGTFFTPDTEMVPISRTIDDNRLVDEIIFKCTHTSEIGWMLPNIPPTGKRIEVPLIVIVGFDKGKVQYEHIHWDQASVLVQIGLLDPTGLPVVGIEGAQKMEKIRQRIKS